MTATKLQKLSQSITPLAGISFIDEEFNRCGLSKLIDTHLGNRQSTKAYRYSDVIKNWCEVFFCGGECAEDIEQHLRPTLENIPANKVAGPDTLLRVLDELSTDTTFVSSSSGQKYRININEKMNRLNIRSLILTGQLKKGGLYDFDFDNQIIEHEKYDAKKTYKMNTGYFPGIATIGDKTVYIENRDGNAGVKLDQSGLLKRACQLLHNHEIYINRSRMDAGSCSKEIIDTVAQNSQLFYIRASRSEALSEQIAQIDNWQTVEINFKSYRVASIPFKQFFEDRNYRFTVAREKSDDQQPDLFEGQKFIYRCILTNDRVSSEKEVIEYCNQRGASEKLFDIQNNDFGRKHLPCSDMNKNTVYLILTAMFKNFYSYIVGHVAKVFKNIQPATRLKRFIFRFICVAGKWIRQSRQQFLRLYTDRPYEKLRFT